MKLSKKEIEEVSSIVEEVLVNILTSAKDTFRQVLEDQSNPRCRCMYCGSLVKDDAKENV